MSDLYFVENIGCDDEVLAKDVSFYDRDEKEFKLAKGVEKVC